MKTAIIRKIDTKAMVSVRATTGHPSSSYGRAVWVDDMGNPYFEVDAPDDVIASLGYELLLDVAGRKKRIGDAIRRAREEHGITRTKLAALASVLRGKQVNVSVINDVEEGSAAYTIDSLLMICDVLLLPIKIG